jgi:hypothetical protein
MEVTDGDISLLFKTPELQQTGITKTYLNLLNINQRIGYFESQPNSDVLLALVLDD